MTTFKIRLKHPSGREILLESVASILNPKSNSIMFIGKKFIDHLDSLELVTDCLVFVLSGLELPENVKNKHIIRFSDNPRKAFGRFLEENELDKLPNTTYYSQNGSLISKDATIGRNVDIAPFSLIDQDVFIGDNCIIHSGVKLLPGTRIGEDSEIQENTVIGSIAMAYEGNQRIPQLGGVMIEKNVSIGANTIIDRGALVDTLIGSDCKIGSMCAIGHNVSIGSGCMIIASSLILGSVSIGPNSFIAGNVSIKNGITIGENVFIGLGSVVTQGVSPNSNIFGNPARVMLVPHKP